MISSIPSHLSVSMRSPRGVAAMIGAATVAGIAWYALRRPKRSLEEIERERRSLLASTGRITDGSITDAPAQQDASTATPFIIVYNYRIGGVEYECAQDVTLLTDDICDIRADLPIQVRYDPHNPGNSIVVAESWSGLRLNPHSHGHEAL